MMSETKSRVATLSEEDLETSVSVVIPTYNEAKNIERIVKRVFGTFEPTPYDLEILVVDDDSPDNTWKLGQALSREMECVRMIRRREDKGLAQSVTEGFSEASGEYCAVIDADLQHPPERLPDLLRALDEGADIAVGSRYVDSGGIENWSLSRKIISVGAGVVSKASVPEARGISDPMSGFFAVRQSVVDDVELDPRGYKILLEVLVNGTYNHVAEVPYTFRERKRGESKLTGAEYINYIEHVGLLGIQSRTDLDAERALRVSEFGLVGGLGAIVNMVVFIAMIYLLEASPLLAGVVAFVVALNWNFLGNWWLTFDQPMGNLPETYLKFGSVSLVGFGIYTVLLVGSIDVLTLPEVVGNGVAIVGAAGVNYMGSETFAFDVGER